MRPLPPPSAWFPPWFGFILPFQLTSFWQRVRSRARVGRIDVSTMSSTWLQTLDVERSKRGEDR